VTVTGAAGARPVTPVGIAAELLDLVVERLDGVPDDVLADLARARDLVSGLDEYAAWCTTPASPDLALLESRTRAHAWDGGLEQEMLSGHVEGAFLRMLVAITRARRVLEVGMFTGYSALAMAEALPADGRLVACEVDADAAAVAQEAFGESEAGSRIEIRLGDATYTLRALAAAGEEFDLVFVDADKAGYAGYLDVLLDEGLLANDGLLVVDNTLLQGEPYAVPTLSDNGAAIAAFNAKVAADERLEQVLVPLRDGVTLARRVS
jgi:caffeoyl-CoA O-methyltransferase